MRFVIVTGLSGAGKTQFLRRLEDMGYFCIDNMPPKLMPSFIKLCREGDAVIDKAAVVMDMRVGLSTGLLKDQMDIIAQDGVKPEIFFLDAKDEQLIRRYKGTKRSHPLSRGGSIIEGIKQERTALAGIREMANSVIDTSDFNNYQLGHIVDEYFADNKNDSPDNDILISVNTFGFKHGIPLDADMVMDVRFLPNPYYVENLKVHSGKNRLVKKYLFDFPQTAQFMDKLLDMVEFLAPLYRHEGKSQLMIAIGCTGGMHRSVAVAELLYEKLKLNGHYVVIRHRDIQLENEQ